MTEACLTAFLDLFHQSWVLLLDYLADVLDPLLDEHVHLLVGVDPVTDGCLDVVDFALGEGQDQEVVHAELGVLLEVKVSCLGDVVEQKHCPGLMLVDVIEQLMNYP